MAVGWAAGIFQLASQPAQTMLQQGDCIAPLLRAERCIGWVRWIKQLHECRSQLLSGTSLRLTLMGVPVAVIDAEQSMQALGTGTAPFRPLLGR